MVYISSHSALILQSIKMTEKEETELSPMILNQMIVSTRKIVKAVKVRQSKKLIGRIRKLTEKATKKGEDKLFENKILRFREEIKAIKELDCDQITKFSLINVKTLKDLNIRGDTPAEKRAFYKLCTHGHLVGAIKKFRQKYPNWHREVPFILQRLGLKYKKDEKKQSKKKISVELIEDKTDKSYTDHKKKGKKKKTLSDVALNPKPKSSSAIDSKPIITSQVNTEPVHRGQMEIRKINLDEIFDDEIVLSSSSNVHLPVQKPSKPSSSFFVGGSGSDDESVNSDNEQHHKPNKSKKEYMKSKFTDSLRDQKPKLSNEKMASGKQVAATIHHPGKAKAPEATLDKDSFEHKQQLHPSWAAKRMAKQRQRMDKPQGTKVIFNDDD